MNKTIVFAALAALTVPSLSVAQAAPSAAQTSSRAVVKVNGLICDFCVQALTRTFRKQASVKDFAVDLNAKEIRIGFKPGQSLDDARIRKLVTDAGYNVVGIARS